MPYRSSLGVWSEREGWSKSWDYEVLGVDIFGMVDDQFGNWNGIHTKYTHYLMGNVSYSVFTSKLTSREVQICEQLYTGTGTVANRHKMTVIALKCIDISPDLIYPYMDKIWPSWNVLLLSFLSHRTLSGHTNNFLSHGNSYPDCSEP